jgi:YD repeat-containing protein
LKRSLLDNPAGLATGTIYNDDGSVQCTGIITFAASIPTGGIGFNDAASVPTGDVAYLTDITSYLYNQMDNLPTGAVSYSSVTDPLGHVTKTYVDSSGRTIETLYDDGSFTQTIYSIGDAAIAGYYISATTLPTIPQGGSETVNVAQRKTGDPVEATIDIYDAAGNLVDVCEPAVANALNGGTMTVPHTHYDYDSSGNEIDQIDAKGNVTTWTFDENGNELSRTLPDGETETFTYNQYGQEATHTDFDGNVANYSYFASGPHAGMLAEVGYIAAAGSGKADQYVTYTYNALGQQATVTDASGTTTDSYDTQGNLIEQQTPEGTIWYVFNPATGQETESYTNYTDTLYGYNNQGELTTVTADKLNGGVLTTSLVIAYTYDAAGNKLAETLPNGELTTYTYDDLNRLTSMVEKRGSTTLFSESFILNDNGLRASATETQLQPDDKTSTFDDSWSYDADDRLTNEAIAATGDASSDDYSDSYTFDLNGNIITDTHTGIVGGTAGMTTNTYNGNDELTTSTVNGVVTVTTFDNNGSEVAVTVGGTITTAYSYDVRNMMIGYSGSNGSATYIYDDAEHRVQETTGGITTYYLTDVQNPTGYSQAIEEHQGSASTAPSRTYLIGDHVFGQVNSGGAISYLVIDGHGSTQQITNASGSVTAALAYTAYGNALNFNPMAIGGAYFFGGGAIYDPISGLYMHGDGVRDQLGIQFIQADPEGDGNNNNPLTLQQYLYSISDPTNEFDPTGRFPAWLVGIFVHAEIGLDFSPTGVGPPRWSNRSIRTIITGITRVAPPISFSTAIRPDLAEWDGGPTGDLYEIKPGDIESYLTDTTYAVEAASAYPQLWAYRASLDIVNPHGVNWGFGTTYKDGVYVWPSLWWTQVAHPGEELVTFANYSVAPGVILYDFVPVPEAEELAAVGSSVSAAQSVIGEWAAIKSVTILAGLAGAWALSASRADEARGEAGLGIVTLLGALA